MIFANCIGLNRKYSVTKYNKFVSHEIGHDPTNSLYHNLASFELLGCKLDCMYPVYDSTQCLSVPSVCFLVRSDRSGASNRRKFSYFLSKIIAI